MLLSALFFNLALPFCLFPALSSICSVKQIDTSYLLNPSSFLTIPFSKPVKLLSATRPQPTPVPTLIPQTPPPAPVSSNSFIDQINDYRRSQGLSPVRTDPYTCGFAKLRVQEIVGNFNHDGFNSRISSKTLPYPSYSKVTENLAMNMDAGDVVNRWINSPGHVANMRADTPYVCVESSGNYYAYEGWKP